MRSAWQAAYVLLKPHIMEKIQVLDKQFRPYIPEAEVKKRVAAMAAQISSDMEGRNPLFVAILNGAFVFAADLFRDISVPAEISFVKVSSYMGTDTTGSVSDLIGLTEDIAGRTVIVVEDIVDTGLSMKHVLEMLQAKKPAEVRIAALLLKPDKLEVSLNIDYCGFKIPNDFILGYGLDYDGYGRNLRDIYVLDTK